MVTATAVASIAITVSCVFIGVIGTEDIQKESFSQSRNVDDECPRGDVPRFLSHETDCSLFYVCLNGRAVLQKCPHNLHFNPRKTVCDFPQNAECQKETPRLPQGRLGDGVFGIQCPSENGRHTIMVSHATDCNKYYICDNGVPHLMTCQSNLHFNPSSQACDYPETAGCETSVTKSPRDQVADENSQLGCPVKNGVLPVLRKHSIDCAKFYICDNGTPHLQECQAGLHFNPKIQACDYPDNANCETNDNSKNDLSKKGKTPDDLLVGCPNVRSDETVLIPNPSDCTKFFMCDRGQSHPRTCPAGLHFNRFRQECDYPEKAECETMGRMSSSGLPSPFCPTISGKIPIFYGHPTNCSIYYLCSNGLAYEFICPARLHFNLRQKVCDYEAVARCPAGKSSDR